MFLVTTKFLGKTPSQSYCYITYIDHLKYYLLITLYRIKTIILILYVIRDGKN